MQGEKNSMGSLSETIDVEHAPSPGRETPQMLWGDTRSNEEERLMQCAMDGQITGGWYLGESSSSRPLSQSNGFPMGNGHVSQNLNLTNSYDGFPRPCKRKSMDEIVGSSSSMSRLEGSLWNNMNHVEMCTGSSSGMDNAEGLEGFSRSSRARMTPPNFPVTQVHNQSGMDALLASPSVRWLGNMESISLFDNRPANIMGNSALPATSWAPQYTSSRRIAECRRRSFIAEQGSRPEGRSLNGAQCFRPTSEILGYRPDGRCPSGTLASRPEGRCPSGTLAPRPDGRCPSGTLASRTDGRCPSGTLASRPAGRCPSGTLGFGPEHFTQLPHPIRSFTNHGAGTNLPDQIRSVLQMMRRGEGLRYEDFLLFDHSLFFRIIDRHRDMRLDVDNMSYEELLALEDRIGYVNTGLSEDIISKFLKIFKYSDACQGEPCCICQEEYSKGDDVGALECDHMFHSECIKKWLKLKNWCPICKTTGLVT